MSIAEGQNMSQFSCNTYMVSVSVAPCFYRIIGKYSRDYPRARYTVLGIDTSCLLFFPAADAPNLSAA